MKIRLLTCALAVAASSLAFAQNSQAPAMSGAAAGKPASTDATFLRKLAAGDLAEVNAGRLAAQKSTNPSVQDFGREMIKDHSENDDQLKSLAASNSVEVPSKPDRAEAAEAARLEQASGSAFDSEYAKAMVRDHEKTVQLLKHEIDHGQMPEVKDFAEKTLAVVNHHLAMAKQLEAGLTSTAAPSSGTR